MSTRVFEAGEGVGADRFDLRKGITFSTLVVSAAYDEPTLRWHIETDTGETVDAQFLIMATGKRPCIDTGFHESFNKPQVRLVDLRKTPLVEVTERGVRTSEQEYEFDAIVFATGYDAVTGALDSIDIRGKGGTSLPERWDHRLRRPLARTRRRRDRGHRGCPGPLGHVRHGGVHGPGLVDGAIAALRPARSVKRNALDARGLVSTPSHRRR